MSTPGQNLDRQNSTSNGTTRSHSSSAESQNNDCTFNNPHADNVDYNHMGDNCDTNNDNESDIDDFDDACCVCQNAMIFYTLLPCRHACVCSSCIRLLDRCPMCRGYIDAYFRINNRSESENEVDDSDTNNRPLNRWQALNQRLNELLGFS